MSAPTKTAPWSDAQFYRVDGIKMAYEQTKGQPDVIVDYEGKRWTQEQLEAAGHIVTPPAVPRKFLMPNGRLA